MQYNADSDVRVRRGSPASLGKILFWHEKYNINLDCNLNGRIINNFLINYILIILIKKLIYIKIWLNKSAILYSVSDKIWVIILNISFFSNFKHVILSCLDELLGIRDTVWKFKISHFNPNFNRSKILSVALDISQIVDEGFVWYIWQH